MAKHRLSPTTPAEYTVKEIISKVLKSLPPIKSRHSSEQIWRDKITHAIVTDMSQSFSPSHQKIPEPIYYVGNHLTGIPIPRFLL